MTTTEALKRPDICGKQGKQGQVFDCEARFSISFTVEGRKREKPALTDASIGQVRARVGKRPRVMRVLHMLLRGCADAHAAQGLWQWLHLRRVPRTGAFAGRSGCQRLQSQFYL